MAGILGDSFFTAKLLTDYTCIILLIVVVVFKNCILKKWARKLGRTQNLIFFALWVLSTHHKLLSLIFVGTPKNIIFDIYLNISRLQEAHFLLPLFTLTVEWDISRVLNFPWKKGNIVKFPLGKREKIGKFLYLILNT